MGDESQARFFEMPSTGHQQDNLAEVFEVTLLGGSQWVFFEERYDSRREMLPTFHGETEELLAVIVVPSVLDDFAANRRPQQGPQERRS